MIRSFLLTASLSLLLCPALRAKEFDTGKVISDIRCKSDREYSYLLYLPSAYRADSAEGWPVLFAQSPHGGNSGDLRRYVFGAEKNNWIIAMSVQSTNGSNENDDAAEAMVEDVFKRVHVDEARCYTTGFSGGAREAFLLAGKRKRNILGIIPCGAGGKAGNSRLLAYGLCGSTCFNRWDMAVSFDAIGEKYGRLRFFAGGHSWAGSDLCFEAITWMNAKYLAKEGRQPEIDAFSGMLMEQIMQKIKTDPYFAYEQACVLAAVTKAPDAAEARKIASTLRKDPKIKLYLEGVEDLTDFVDDHFNTSPMDYRNNPCTSSQQKDAAKLLEKYADTPLAGIIEGFGKPSPAP